MYTQVMYGQSGYIKETRLFKRSEVPDGGTFKSGIKEKDLKVTHNLRPGDMVKLVKTSDGIPKEMLGANGVVVALVVNKVVFVTGMPVDVAVYFPDIDDANEFAADELEKL